jgi:hypothetical protein
MDLLFNTNIFEESAETCVMYDFRTNVSQEEYMSRKNKLDTDTKLSNNESQSMMSDNKRSRCDLNDLSNNFDFMDSCV